MGRLQNDIEKTLQTFAFGERFTASDVAKKLGRKNGVGIADVLTSLVQKGSLRRRQNGVYERRFFSLDDIKCVLGDLSALKWEVDGFDLYAHLANDVVIRFRMSRDDIRDLHNTLGQHLVSTFIDDEAFHQASVRDVLRDFA